MTKHNTSQHKAPLTTKNARPRGRPRHDSRLGPVMQKSIKLRLDQFAQVEALGGSPGIRLLLDTLLSEHAQLYPCRESDRATVSLQYHPAAAELVITINLGTAGAKPLRVTVPLASKIIF